jgi:hypothetical protein
VRDPELGRLDPISGSKNDVSVTLTGMTHRTAKGERRYPYPDFGSDFIEALHKQLVGPRRRGLLRSTLVCPSCGSALDAQRDERTAVAVDVALPRIPAIGVALEMPGITCTSCHRSVVRIDDRGVQSDLSDALIVAFDMAGIRPG